MLLSLKYEHMKCFFQACDAMFHLCRTFEDPDITHVEGDVSAARMRFNLQ